MTQRILVLLVLARAIMLAEPQAAITKGLNVFVLQGDGVIHDLPSPTESRISIRVADANGTPIPNATAVFEFPEIGPSAALVSDGSAVKVLLTDSAGAATILIRSNRVPGQFEPRVMVNYLGQSATVTLKQENAFAAGARPDVYRKYAQTSLARPRWKKWLYILGVAGGAAAGVVIATRGNSSPGDGGGIVITPGSGTVGGRQ